MDLSIFKENIKYFGIVQLIHLPFIPGEQQLNPQREVPALDDDGFVIGESVAIMQYLCDQYAPENPIYPQDPKERALVNHRMCFNMNYYYANISPYAVNSFVVLVH